MDIKWPFRFIDNLFHFVREWPRCALYLPLHYGINVFCMVWKWPELEPLIRITMFNSMINPLLPILFGPSSTKCIVFCYYTGNEMEAADADAAANSMHSQWVFAKCNAA